MSTAIVRQCNVFKGLRKIILIWFVIASTSIWFHSKQEEPLESFIFPKPVFATFYFDEQEKQILLKGLESFGSNMGEITKLLQQRGGVLPLRSTTYKNWEPDLLANEIKKGWFVFLGKDSSVYKIGIDKRVIHYGLS